MRGLTVEPLTLDFWAGKDLRQEEAEMRRGQLYLWCHQQLRRCSLLMTSQITICSMSGFLGEFRITVSDWMIPIPPYSLATIIPFSKIVPLYVTCLWMWACVGACVHLERVSVVCSQMQVCTLVIYVVCENKPWRRHNEKGNMSCPC